MIIEGIKRKHNKNVIDLLIRQVVYQLKFLTGFKLALFTVFKK